MTDRLAEAALGWALGLLLFMAQGAAWAQNGKVPVSLGAGFAVTDQGHVVTACHVVRDKSQIVVSRPFEVFRKAEAPIMAVVGRNAPKDARAASAEKPGYVQGESINE